MVSQAYIFISVLYEKIMLELQWKMNSFARSEVFTAAIIDKIPFWTMNHLVKKLPTFQRLSLSPHQDLSLAREGFIINVFDYGLFNDVEII
jgi:hypothetical protein